MKKKEKTKKRKEIKKTIINQRCLLKDAYAEILGGTVFIRRVYTNTHEKAY